ncbi:GAF domain-containing protein [Mycobacterium paraintracellulare]|uniref:GAF domain-containing protein n=2 Tax=Mycobacteriaceae TaxID=1762 RepID=A0ABN6APG7_9MYCO|nr:antitermination regulator [Mycobacterium paraintracellulare]BBY70768.1 GAF domain-containing protein [Mycobacterium paraintracellulare]BCP09131.1 GAF domain-containing protein [Mycobacterium paraintracellulare]
MPAIEEQLLAAMGEQRGVGAADRLCEACVGLLGIDAAAVSLVFDGANIGTLGASGPAARIYDEEQFTHGEGPCLDAVAYKAPVVVVDLADPAETRWPAYGPAMLAREIRGVYAMPIMVAGEYVGALDLFQTTPTMLAAEQVAGVTVAAELAQMPMLDLLEQNLDDAAAKPGSTAWNEINNLTRSEVSQATGMLMAQLNLAAPVALVRLRAHAYATGRSATEIARDILERRLRLDPH